MQSRREFMKQALIGSGLLMAGQFPFEAFAASKEYKLTILHTNDTHSHIDPFPMDGSKYQGLGGIERRAAMIEKIRAEEPHVLLFDAGDIFQGTPYFNLYKGELELKAMSQMRYDAATMGNHDFDAGLEGFLKQLPHANFPFLTANYDFDQTILKGATQTYKIFTKGGIKIGVFGLGVQLWGLVPNDAYGKTRYLDPIPIAQSLSRELKHKKKCDLVVCLSHLGYQYQSNKVSDVVLAQQTEDIDVIIGGHTHTFLEQAVRIKNKLGREVIVNQVGWAGINLGRMDFIFDYKKNTKRLKAYTVILGKQTSV